MRRFQIIAIVGLLCALTACGVVKDNENDTISSAIVEDLDNKQVFDEDGLSGLKDTELNNLTEEDSMIEENDSSEYDELVCEEDFSENDEMKSIENVLEELAGEYEYTRIMVLVNSLFKEQSGVMIFPIIKRIRLTVF